MTTYQTVPCEALGIKEFEAESGGEESPLSLNDDYDSSGSGKLERCLTRQASIITLEKSDALLDDELDKPAEDTTATTTKMKETSSGMLRTPSLRKRSSVVISYNIIKGVYIIFLLPYHIHGISIPSHSPYASKYLPYDTVDHGLEYMFGILLISGWLSNATFKPDQSAKEHIKKKLSRLLPPYIIALLITFICILIIARDDIGVWIQFGLECLTIGGWNPFLVWYSVNLPLWFISMLLMYHCVSPKYLQWLRDEKTSNTKLWIALLSFYFFRIIAQWASLHVIFSTNLSTKVPETGSLFFDEYFIIHTWAPLQLPIPFIGATMYQISNNCNGGRLASSPKWIRWILTDFVSILCMALTICIPMIDNDYWNPLVSLSDVFAAPFIMFAVYMYQFDDNSLVWLYKSYDGFMNLFDYFLALSYPLYLVHWPFILILLHECELFHANTMESMIGLMCISLVFTQWIQMFLVVPFGQYVAKKFPRTSKK